MALPSTGTYFSPSDPESRLNWERLLAHEIVSPRALISPKSGLVGKDNKSVIQRRVEQFKRGGTSSRITLVRGYRREPVMGNQTLREREEGLDTSTFDWNINLLRHAGKTDGEIVDQRIEWDIADEIRANHREYWPTILEAGMLMHAAGFTVNTTRQTEWWLRGAKLNMTLCNATVAPDSNHIMRGGALTDDATVGTTPTAILDVNDIDDMTARADTLPLPIGSVNINGMSARGILVLHTYQVQTLRKKNTTWFATMQNAIKGGLVAKNPLFSGKFQGVLGMWNDVVIMQSRFIPPGVSNAGAAVANTRRAVFLGAQALTLGLGKNYANENTFKIASDKWDYGDKVGIAIRCLIGAAKTRFAVTETAQTEDFGSIVFTSYAKDVVTE